MKRHLLIILVIIMLILCVATLAGCNLFKGSQNPDDEKISFTVTFDTQGGSSIAPIAIGEGETLTLPQTPTKEGYIFDGWYLDSSCVEALEEGYLVNKSITLYAKWRIGKCEQHNSVLDKGYVPTCTQKGLTDGAHCAKCGEILKEQSEIPELGHDIEHHKAKTATCTEVGWEAYDTCKREGCTYSTYIEIVALGHDVEHHEAKAATCTEIGWEAYDTCKREGCDYTTYEEIPPHSFDENGVCTVCGYSETGLTFTLNKDGKSYSVSGIGTFTGTDLVIPKANFDAKPVTNISNEAFRDCSSLTSITIPDSVTDIGSFAFYGCSSLESITIPFVGKSNSATAYEAVLGYIFGYTSVTRSGHYGSSTTANEKKATWFVDIQYSAFSEATWQYSCYNDYGDYWYCSNDRKQGYRLQSYHYYIPSSLKNVTVTGSEVSECAFNNCSGLTSVTIGSSVTSIGSYAFSRCRGLTSIMIPDSVTSVDRYAFNGCSGLTNITIPDSVTSIGKGTLSGCSSLENITIPFVGASKTASDGYDQVFGYIFGYDTTDSSSSSVPEATFQYYQASIAGYPKYYHYYILSSIKSVIITGGEITPYAFQNCSGLTSITIPDSVTSIGDDAFNGCSGLTSVTIPDSVTSIGDDAFNGCSGLTSVTIPDSVMSIGGGAFQDCTRLKSITIPDGVTSIYYGTFYGCRGLTSITIPDSVTSIGNSAFEKCTRLTSITIPDGVTSIGSYAFNFCGLTNIAIPRGVTIINSFVFKQCDFTSIIIPDSVTAIGEQAFSQCNQLVSVTIGVGVTDIGKRAFASCSKLKTVNWNASRCTSVGKEDGGADYTIFQRCTNLASVNIGENVRLIPAYAFYNCKELTSVTIGNSLERIVNNAFFGCSKWTSIYYTGDIAGWCGISGLSNIMSSSRTLYIGGNKVEGDLILPDGVTSIGNSAFCGRSGLTSITIPDSVTSIGEDAFYNCKGLTSITIPKSVTSIGDWAFRSCTVLTRIDFKGTKAQWSAISKGEDWNSKTGNYTVYCINGTVSI